MQEPATGTVDPLVIYVSIGAGVAVLLLACLIGVCVSCRNKQNKDVPFKSRGLASVSGPDYDMVSECIT